MKKYIKQAGYKFTKDADDLTDKQFSLLSIEYFKSENSTLGNIVTDRTETYQLFLKTLDPDTFGTKINNIVKAALADGVNIYEEFNISLENVENGFDITMNFNILGE